MIQRKKEVTRIGLMKKISGVTILEMLLALAIISFILTLVARQLSVAQNDTNAQQLQATVDRLFQSAANYYYGNCRQQVDSNNAVPADATDKATLDPVNVASTSVPFPVMNQTLNLLTAGKYLISTQTWPPSPNTFIDGSGTTDDHGFVVQFNPVTPSRSPAGIYQNWETVNGSTGTGVAMQSNPSYRTPSLTSVGTIYIWRIQVSVKLAPGLVPDATTFKLRFSADCLSSQHGGYVDPCSANNPGEYLVWERLPSFASPKTATNYWTTMPGVKEFNQLYTNDDLYGAENSTFRTTSGVTGANNNYLCGG